MEACNNGKLNKEYLFTLVAAQLDAADLCMLYWSVFKFCMCMKCWTGYRKTGTQTIHGKLYNKCVKCSHTKGMRKP